MEKKFDIQKKITDKAKECRYGCSCLNGGRKICPVKSAISEKLIRIDKKNNDNCRYCIPFGSDLFCACPVRQAIYAEYRK